jgi:hypothetical protein
MLVRIRILSGSNNNHPRLNNMTCFMLPIFRTETQNWSEPPSIPSWPTAEVNIQFFVSENQLGGQTKHLSAQPAKNGKFKGAASH